MRDKNTTWGKVPFFAHGAPDSSAGQREPLNPPVVGPHGSAELFLQTHGPHRVNGAGYGVREGRGVPQVASGGWRVKAMASRQSPHPAGTWGSLPQDQEEEAQRISSPRLGERVDLAPKDWRLLVKP